MYLLLAAMLFACSAAPMTTPSAPETALIATWGTAAPYKVVVLPPDGRWAVICQARSDTNGDGKLLVDHELHGEERGDRLTAYLIDPQGGETTIDYVLAADHAGRWLALVEHGRPVLIDTASWRRTPLTGTLPQFRVDQGLADWTFDPSGDHLLFMHDGAPISRELATGRETRIAPAAWRVKWSYDGAWIEIESLAGDTNHDGFVVGPDLSPMEGTSGGNCGWGDLWNEPPRSEQHDPDELVHSLWRVSDGRTVPGDRAIDRDTIAVLDRGRLAIGPVDQAGSPTPADCAVEEVVPAAHGALLVCGTRDQPYVVARCRHDRRGRTRLGYLRLHEARFRGGPHP